MNLFVKQGDQIQSGDFDERDGSGTIVQSFVKGGVFYVTDVIRLDAMPIDTGKEK